MGYCILQDAESFKIVDAGAISLTNKKKFPSLIIKALKIEELFKTLHLNHSKINNIAIEAPLIRFQGHLSSAQTIAILNRFNAMVSWLGFKEFGLEPEYIDARSARRICEIPKIEKGQNVKKIVFETTLAKLDPSIQQFVILTRNKTTSPLTYDMVDSYIIARAACILQRNKQSKQNLIS